MFLEVAFSESYELLGSKAAASHVSDFLRACLLSQPSYSHPQAGLEVSLFEQLQSNGVKTFLLDTQYRMHPELAAFPSERYYGGLLRSFPRPEDRLPPKGYGSQLQRSFA